MNHSHFEVREKKDKIEIWDNGTEEFLVATFRNGYVSKKQLEGLIRVLWPDETED